MNSKYFRQFTIIITMFTLFLLVACSDKGVEAELSKATIAIIRNGDIIAEGIGTLRVDRYEPGDMVRIVSDDNYISVKLVEDIEEAVVYIPNGKFEFVIPSGNDAKVFKEGTFAKENNSIEVRNVKDTDLKVVRNIAINPFDYRYETEVTRFDAKVGSLPEESVAVSSNEVLTYPHAYANRITRNEAQFYARNAIDGVSTANVHGYYPAHSWGGGLYDDLEYVVYFGREVTVSKIALALRSDFNVSGGKEHDTYWDEMTVVFSDGQTHIINPIKTGEYQEFEFDNILTTNVRIKNLRRNNDTPSEMYAALNEIQVWGY